MKQINNYIFKFLVLKKKGFSKVSGGKKIFWKVLKKAIFLCPLKNSQWDFKKREFLLRKFCAQKLNLKILSLIKKPRAVPPHSAALTILSKSFRLRVDPVHFFNQKFRLPLSIFGSSSDFRRKFRLLDFLQWFHWKSSYNKIFSMNIKLSII